MMSKTDIIKVKERFMEASREKGLRLTPQRTAIFYALASTKEHPTIETLYKKIRKSLPNISFDTVYRTVNLFVDHGIIKQVESFTGSRRFDAAMDEHHHFTCIKCGRIIDFINKEYNNLKIPEQIRKKYKITGKKVVLVGVCDRCKK